MLHIPRNMAVLDNILLRDALQKLKRLLPPGWSASEATGDSPSSGDAILKISSPYKRTALITLKSRPRIDPKGVRQLLQTPAALRQETRVVVAPYLSEGTRSRLRDGGIGYLDLTGNARIVVSKPGLYIETQGASQDPNREERPARSMRGTKTGRIVRALIDRKDPPGVRELATMTNSDAGYVSRVLSLLDSEALITRVGHGKIQSVDWPALLRRWAQEAPLESRGEVRTFLDPRGLSTLLARLAGSTERYAVSGSLAAAGFAPITAPRDGVSWMRDVADAAKKLGLRATDSGANVMLLEPLDESAFEGAETRDGIWYAAPSQVAADLLTSPGRGPAEAEELIAWMQVNQEKWRR